MIFELQIKNKKRIKDTILYTHFDDACREMKEFMEAYPHYAFSLTTVDEKSFHYEVTN